MPLRFSRFNGSFECQGPCDSGDLIDPLNIIESQGPCNSMDALDIIESQVSCDSVDSMDHLKANALAIQ